jgi:hypothetical protein
LIKNSIFKKPESPPSTAERAAGATARRRLELWVEYKRLHLGFTQALNSLTYGYSSTLALIKHAMLAEYEARKLTGEEPDGSQCFVIGDAMGAAVKRCRAAYGGVTSKTFDDKALSSLSNEPSPHIIQIMLALTTAPFDSADAALVEMARRQDLEDPERARRFTPEIRKMHHHLRAHFADLAKRGGLA